MARKKRPEKRARVEEDGMEGRTGVTWRPPKFVVEVRVSKKVAVTMSKLHLGSYNSVNEAMVARDYAAYFRDSTGKEDLAKVGGFRDVDAHPSIFKFEESPEVFRSLEGSGSRAQARCDEYKSLLELPTSEACTKFCRAAREDVSLAIESFRRRDPQNFPSPLLKSSPNAEPVDGEIHRTPLPSSSQVRVSPTPGREVEASMGEESTSFIGALSPKVQITVNGSVVQTPLRMNMPRLTPEEIFMITKALDRFKQELIDELLEELGPCPIEPETIPALE